MRRALSDHYHRVQREAALREARSRTRQAHSYAIRALWGSALATVPATIALLAG